MSFTKVTSAGIGSTELVTLDSLEVINNASIGGVLTYEDVTNVDSIGIITARAGVLVGSGITLSKDGDVFFTGIATGNGSGLTALNASNIGSGTVPTARLGSGTASSSTFLRGDSTFAAVTSTTINNNADNRLITGSGTANTLEGESTLTYDGTNLDLNADNKKLRLGGGNDIELYTDGSNSFLTNENANWYIQGSSGSNSQEILIRPKSGEQSIRAIADGAVELYNNNVKMFQTNGAGVDVFQNLYLADNVNLKIGTGADFSITHNGTLTKVLNESSRLIISGSASDNVDIMKTQSEYMAKFIPDGAVELYHNNVKKLNTFDSGVVVSGDIQIYDGNELQMGSSSDFHIGHDGTNNIIDAVNSHSIRIQAAGNNVWEFGAAGSLKGNDGKKIILGDSSDLQFFHDGSYNYIDCLNGKQLRIVNDTQGGNELMIKANPNGAVELYNDGVKQINTHPNGIFTRGIYPMSDNSFSIGSGSQRFTTIYATNGSINTSDKNEKNTIVESDLGLDFVNKLKPVSYKWNEDDGKTHYGLIAQEVEETVIDIGKTVSDFGAIDKPDGDPMGLSYNEFISPLIKAVQELTAKNDALEARIKTLEG